MRALSVAVIGGAPAGDRAGIDLWLISLKSTVRKQSRWQERQATGWCRAQQLPQKMQAGGMLAKGGERGRQETLGRR
jgi:hypothetical protein